MEKTRTLNAKGLGVRAGLAAAVVIITLGLCGCGNELARMEENQLALQEILEANAEQIAAIRTCIERNQEDVSDRIERLQTSVDEAEIEIAGIRNKQLKLEEMAQESNGLLVNKIDKLGQNQQSLQAGIEKLENRTQEVSAAVANVAEGQVELQEVVQNNKQELVSKIDAVEQKQGEYFIQVDDLRSEVRTVAQSISLVQESLARLQQNLQQNLQQVLSIIEANRQAQLQFEQSVQKDMQSMSESLNKTSQMQTELQKQIADVRGDTKALNDDVTIVLEQMQAAPSQTSPPKPTEPAKIDRLQIEPPVSRAIE